MHASFGAGLGFRAGSASTSAVMLRHLFVGPGSLAPRELVIASKLRTGGLLGISVGLSSIWLCFLPAHPGAHTLGCILEPAEPRMLEGADNDTGPPAP